MGSDIAIGKANGAALIIANVVKIIFMACVAISVITLFMIYALGQGAWTFRAFNNLRVVDICSFSLQASVLTGVAYSAVFKPIALVAQNSVRKKVLFSDLVGLSENDVYAMRYFERLFNTTTACTVASGVIAGAIALFAHDFIMDAIGNPATDILTLLIIVLGPYVLSVIFASITTGGLKRESPELYNAWLNS